MKSVGEVMAIGRTFEESLQKAIRQIDPRYTGFEAYVQPEDLDYALANPTDTRLFAIAYAMFNKRYTVEMIHELTKIDKVRLLLSRTMTTQTDYILFRCNSGSCSRSRTL